jgi:acetoin utilization protein AcuB
MENGDTKLKVIDCMSESPIVVDPAESLGAAIGMLFKWQIHELPVVEDGRLVGIITDRDLRQVSPSYPIGQDQPEVQTYLQTLKVRSCMTPAPIVVEPGTPLVEAVKLMRSNRIDSLPVVEAEKLVGLVSISDVLDVFIEQND